jgi:hypothetical protein
MFATDMDAHELPTPRSTLRTRCVADLLTSQSCLRNRIADLEVQVAVANGRSDTRADRNRNPLARGKFLPRLPRNIRGGSYGICHMDQATGRP